MVLKNYDHFKRVFLWQIFYILYVHFPDQKDGFGDKFPSFVGCICYVDLYSFKDNIVAIINLE